MPSKVYDIVLAWIYVLKFETAGQISWIVILNNSRALHHRFNSELNLFSKLLQWRNIANFGT